MDYDAESAPRPDEWLATSEPDRLAAVEAHHRALSSPHPPTPKPRVHAALHLVVESQLAADAPPEARRALARLLASGRTRHEAVHAIAAVAAGATEGVLAGGRFDAAAYGRALDALAPAAGAPQG